MAKNPYALYHFNDPDSTVNQRKQSMAVQKKVTAMVNRIVQRAKQQTLNDFFIENEKNDFRRFDASTGVHDTASREMIWSVIQDKLKKTGMSRGEARHWADRWWDF